MASSAAAQCSISRTLRASGLKRVLPSSKVTMCQQTPASSGACTWGWQALRAPAVVTRPATARNKLRMREVLHQHCFKFDISADRRQGAGFVGLLDERAEAAVIIGHFH